MVVFLSTNISTLIVFKCLSVHDDIQLVQEDKNPCICIKLATHYNIYINKTYIICSVLRKTLSITASKDCCTTSINKQTIPECAT